MSVETLGNYQLEGLLGEGGIGQVYAAQDKVLGRRVAIKSLRPELSRDRSFVDRFYNEAKSLANLNHTNITTLYALHVEANEAFMVMELVHGQTLEALLARVGRLTLRDSLAILAQAVPGIRYAHRRGVVHRDLKPANLMLTDDGVVKIMDFGIARVQGSQHLTRVGEFCGTFVYASPEQIRGEDVDERSDLYSLAIVLYRMLAGEPPFSSDNEYALMTAQLQTPPPPLTGRVPDLDPATEAVLMRALAKRPEDRQASVEEFGRVLGAMAMRGESIDILQQLYAHAFAAEDPETTRISSSPRRPAVESTRPSNPSARRTADWQLPPSVAGNVELPQPAPSAPGRRSVLAEAQTAGSKVSPPGSSASYRRWVAGAAVMIPLLLAGGYFVAQGVPTFSPVTQPRPVVSEPAPPVSAGVGHQDQKAASATPVEAAKSEPPPPAPVEATKREPPPAPVEAAKREPPPAPVEAVKREPPPPAPVEAVKREPPPPAPVEAAKREPPAAPVEAAKPEPPPSPPPAPVEAPQNQAALPASPPSKPVEVEPSEVKSAAASPPGPVANTTGPPPSAPAAGELASNKPNPAPSNSGTASAPTTPVAVAKNETPAVAEPAAPLGPRLPAAPPQPEGEPDLQGKVTGAKRLDEIEIASRWIKIYGIVDRARGAQEAEHVRALVRYLKSSKNHLVCYRKATDTYRCYSDGQDIARLALQDGMVQLAPNAPAEYRSLLNARR